MIWSVSRLPRRLNHLNEWGGFSRYLGLSVFTAWRDLTEFDKLAKTTTAIVSDSAWDSSPAGLNNQERWVEYALAHGSLASFFIIHPVDETASPRSISEISSDRVFIGGIHRDGTKAVVVGQPVAIELASAARNGRSSSPQI